MIPGEAGALVRIGTDSLFCFSPTTVVRSAPPGNTRYLVSGIRLYRTVEVFCDEDGYVCKRIGNDGIAVYYNRFNGWHSGPASALAAASKGW